METAPGARRGTPRKVHEIFAATLELLREQGYAGLTIEGVAARSGVNKTTIYRWWPGKGALLGEALLGARDLDLRPPDTGSLRGDLEELMHTICVLLATPPAAEIAISTLGAVTHSRDLAGYAHDFFADRLARERAVFDRAVRRGELDPSVDPMLLVDLLVGAAWVRVVFRGLPVDDRFAQEAVATVLGSVDRPITPSCRR
ncbi:TetR/AcrR family transcriptional regulator [Leekyejoonella antrihumi]|uniref:TetR/AcrR family transcriptional regulator n=1 Tax=Leekyejoonella antrihumi TaxID=1660198 RepID=A0A563E1W1_9MICO|nr:TetR/AcrR family transcriptional regulator [Leekyejoonella antrihumi]TWP36191.1 TetR/AcrR family transcriptional regulator [Leekyejoonella antrihumi]